MHSFHKLDSEGKNAEITNLPNSESNEEQSHVLNNFDDDYAPYYRTQSKLRKMKVINDFCLVQSIFRFCYSP